MILDGKSIALSICNEIAEKVAALKTRKPHLAFILVGKNPASETYVRSKKKASVYTGIESTLLELPETLSQEELLHHIHLLNVNPLIDGILVQLPLPRHIDERAITFAIDPTKDVDGFHPLNVGKMLLGDEGGFLPCTPLGIKVLLEKSKISVEGKRVVIVGRSNIVGKPLAAILMQKKPHCNASVTIALLSQGFLAASIRAMLTGLQLLVKPPYPVKIFGTLAEASRNLEAQARGLDTGLVLEAARKFVG